MKKRTICFDSHTNTVQKKFIKVSSAEEPHGFTRELAIYKLAHNSSIFPTLVSSSTAATTIRIRLTAGDSASEITINLPNNIQNAEVFLTCEKASYGSFRTYTGDWTQAMFIKIFTVLFIGVVEAWERPDFRFLHNDLHPGNLLLSIDNNDEIVPYKPFLTDFGLSVIKDNPSAKTIQDNIWALIHVGDFIYKKIKQKPAEFCAQWRRFKNKNFSMSMKLTVRNFKKEVLFKDECKRLNL